MLYENLVKAAQRQDARNRFNNAAGAELPVGIPHELALYYRDTSPANVYLRLQSGEEVYLFAPHELNGIQREYASGEYYVFATSNGDPIAIFEGSVWRATHGRGAWQFQRTAASVAQFWGALLQSLSEPESRK